MSKRRKRQHTEDHAVAPPRAQRKAPTHPVMPSRCRDPLFGSPLTLGTVRLPLLDYDTRRPRARQEPIPLAIHRHMPESGRNADGTINDERLGSPQFHPRYVFYMRDLATLRAEQWQQWWQQRSILSALSSHIESGIAPFSYDELNAVVAYLRGGDWGAWDHVPYWFDTRAKRITAYVRRYFLPDRRQFAGAVSASA